MRVHNMPLSCTRSRVSWRLPIVSLCLLYSAHASAAQYYVDQANAAANDQNAGTESAPWKTIARANQALNPGDTVLVKAGTYNSYIAPARSGTADARISFKSFGTDAVVIEGAAYGILLDGKSYITVQGINFTNLDRFMYLRNGANQNIIAYSKFEKGRSNSWAGSIIDKNSSYNWIHHVTFARYGECLTSYGSGSDQGTTLDIGNEEDGSDASSFNVVENSTLYHAGHHVLGVFSRYNTIRNNYLHNEAWSNGRGHRNLYLQGVASGSGNVLIEGNRFGYASRGCNDASPTVGSVAMSTSRNIFRHNSIFHSVAYGIGTYSYVNQDAKYDTGSNNKIYNNTIFNSGYGIDSAYKGGSEDAAIWFAASVNTGNQVKNNLYFANRAPHTGYTGQQVITNNWNGSTQGDPKFVSASITPPADKSDPLAPDLRLRADSPAIDQGGALTTVSSPSGSGSVVAVADASYFQDGRYGPPGVLQADWIALGSVGNVAQIASISGNTITLAKAVSWTSGAAVWLYRKSDGERVLYGAAPDPGAKEYPQGELLLPPTNLQVK
jgi:Protein of unknown function (DUF1565)